MCTLTTIAAIEDDNLAVEALLEFVENGEKLDKRKRAFDEVNSANEHREWIGEIRYGDAITATKAIIAPIHVLSTQSIDWLIVSAIGSKGKTFTTSPRWLRGARISQHIERISGRRLAVFDPAAWIKRHNPNVVRRNVANNLGAEITSRGIFRPLFLQFPGGQEGEHFRTVADWVKEDRQIRLVASTQTKAAKV